MCSDLLSHGRPYGGCSILYQKSLRLCVTQLDSCTGSSHFCGIRVSDLSGLSYLLISLYMPTNHGPVSYCDFLNTLGELEGFIVSQIANYLRCCKH